MGRMVGVSFSDGAVDDATMERCDTECWFLLALLFAETGNGILDGAIQI